MSDFPQPTFDPEDSDQQSSSQQLSSAYPSNQPTANPSTPNPSALNPSTLNPSTPTPAPANTPQVPGPLTLGKIIDRAFRLYRNNFGLLLMTAAIFLVPLGVVSGWLTGNFMVGYLDMVQTLPEVLDQSGGDPMEEIAPILAPFAGFVGIYIVMVIVSLLLQGLVTLSLTAHSLAALRGEALTVGESIRIGWNRLAAYIGKTISQGFIIAVSTIGLLMLFGCAIFAIVMAIGGASAFGAGFDSAFEPGFDPGPIAIVGLVITVICGYLFALMLMLAPALFLSGRYVAATVGLVDQNWGPIESLQKSWGLTKNHTWRSIGYIFLLGLLTFILVSLPLSVVQNALTSFADYEMLATYTGIFAGASSLMNVLWQPFYAAAVVLFYTDLRVRQEHYDLELRLQQIEGDLASSPQPPALL